MESERLLLRPFSLDDAEALYQLAKDEEVGINAGWEKHTSVEMSKEVIENIFMKSEQYAIILKEDSKIIGAVGLVPDPKRENPDVKMLGYWIGKAYWRNGYATEASNIVLEDAFENKGYERISVYHYAYNEGSKAVIEKLGFVYEGYQHQSSKRYDGVVLDDVLYSMSKEDYQKRKEAERK
ncbi:RimJ/RimL family protein N-acetyltransferase [Breznakia sp. PF5-3]|uniref:GNAT family N-acetyltransferase n=1 Tax=unclassified Breznakia TaxID=2623764 RepID=UPI002406E3BC|nr:MULTISPECIES: GNAT family protein [unclassified Breznakia]MDL2276514.1 GNAT family N-acetyltransferase [Breznakia sp. OttesenSCG-928-G09]MDF9825805.1 RimJ/RimL family protein N-acetyltransferase [Breznakia sp. PM6-1]MDF9836610.1 RimJ/RimL family protein N-acetyltransferase [Breznakia sp. PF5-3]MDF9838840.1 RimJ/RimL family protein N-acetyltransferase [Breznakia sp. PFB2-8]MDF9860866.1 RimJ/RimL family protein N-acetyltransferase [Breznakia sp. PH5-24]